MPSLPRSSLRKAGTVRCLFVNPMWNTAQALLKWILWLIFWQQYFWESLQFFIFQIELPFYTLVHLETEENSFALCNTHMHEALWLHFNNQHSLTHWIKLVKNSNTFFFNFRKCPKANQKCLYICMRKLSKRCLWNVITHNN